MGFVMSKLAPGQYVMLDDEGTRGLYGLMFGENVYAEKILSTLHLERLDLGRYRDVWVINGEIAILTRNGGENRNCAVSPIKGKQDCGFGLCFSCIITYRIKSHPNYLRDRDEAIDQTYATIFFSLPLSHREMLMGLNIDWGWQPFSSDRFREGMERLTKALEETKKIQEENGTRVETQNTEH